MKTDLFKFLHHRPEIRFNRKVVVFIVCLFIACFSWLQINLSESYIENIPLKVDFINLPKTRFGTLKISDTLLVEVEADGYSFLKYEMKTISVDFKKLRKDKNFESYYFIPGSYSKTIAKHLGDNFKVLRTVIDTLQLNPTLK